MKHTLQFAVALLATFSSVALFGQNPCNDYKVYYINIAPGEGSSILYEVEIDGNTASLTQLETLPVAAHIGVSGDGDLYIVTNFGRLFIYDPSTGTASPEVQITFAGAPLTGIPHVVVDGNGVLHVASTETNSVYSVDASTGEATLVAAIDAEIRGGDLLITNDGTLWLANRLDNTFYNITEGGVPGFSVGLNNINGAATLEDGTIIVANAGSTAFNLIDPATGLVLEATLQTDIIFLDGDLAAACVSSVPVIDDECFGFNALVYTPGTGNIPDNRMDPENALGAPDRDDTINFVSLGFGGTLIIGFEEAAIALPAVDDLEVVETTFGNQTCNSFEERAHIYVSQQVVADASEIDDALFVYVGESCTNGAFFDVHAATGFEYFTLVKIVDVTPTAAQLPNRDGYDVDGIVALHGCAPVPPQFVPGDCYAAEMIEYNQGTQLNGSPLTPDRTNPFKALDAPERTDANVFVTLGYGGYIILGFEGGVENIAGDDLEIVETSFGNQGCAAYPEYADVYVSQNGDDFFFARTVCKSDPFVDISDAGNFAFITKVKIVNNNSLSTTFDGYDLDGVVAIANCEDENLTPPAQLNSSSLAVESALKTMPNPTSGVTQVVFATANPGRTVVEIIDLNGRVVETLFNQETIEGQEYRTDFNANNLNSGIYIARMLSGSEVVISKIMVTR